MRILIVEDNEIEAEILANSLEAAGYEVLRAASDVKARTEVRAPQTGKIVNLHHFTPGGVVKPGDDEEI